FLVPRSRGAILSVLAVHRCPLRPRHPDPPVSLRYALGSPAAPDSSAAFGRVSKRLCRDSVPNGLPALGSTARNLPHGPAPLAPSGGKRRFGGRRKLCASGGNCHVDRPLLRFRCLVQPGAVPPQLSADHRTRPDSARSFLRVHSGEKHFAGSGFPNL